VAWRIMGRALGLRSLALSSLRVGARVRIRLTGQRNPVWSTLGCYGNTRLQYRAGLIEAKWPLAVMMAECYRKGLSGNGLQGKNEGGKKTSAVCMGWAVGEGSRGMGWRKGKEEKGCTGPGKMDQRGVGCMGKEKRKGLGQLRRRGPRELWKIDILFTIFLI
jgi:hypothetical protein